MRTITDHHDGHGLTESLTITADAPGPGGASHRYVVTGELLGPLADIQFQKGPRREPFSTHGIVESVLLAIVADRMRAFQVGPYACEENAQLEQLCRDGMALLKKRADARAARGVLGTTTR